MLARDDAINAFAAGWGPDDAVIAVTRGALERLTREELQGVVAHEFSHLAHGDTRLNMRLIGLVWGLQLIFDLGRTMAQRDERGHVPASALFGIALIGVGSISRDLPPIGDAVAEHWRVRGMATKMPPSNSNTLMNVK